MGVTRRKQHRPGIAPNDNTTHHLVWVHWLPVVQACGWSASALEMLMVADSGHWHLSTSCLHGEGRTRPATPKKKKRSTQQEKKKKQIGHHARPRRASATATLCAGADICKTGYKLPWTYLRVYNYKGHRVTARARKRCRCRRWLTWHDILCVR